MIIINHLLKLSNILWKVIYIMIILFDKDFSEAMKDSIIEFSIVSLAIIEREDFEKFEMEKKIVKIELINYYFMVLE